MRELFLSRLIELLEKDSVNWEIFSKQKYDQIINEVKQAKNKLFRDPADNVLLQKYNVVIEDNIEKLVKPSIFNRHKYYIYEEQLYDIIYSVHMETGHGALPELLKSMQMKYVEIPLPIIQLWLSLCQVCKSQKHLLHELGCVKSESSQRIRVTQQDNWLSNYSKTPQETSVPDKQITVIDLSDDDEIPSNNVVHQVTMADCNNKNIDDNNGRKNSEEIAVLNTVNNKNSSDDVSSIPSSSFSVPNLPSAPNHQAPDHEAQIPNVSSHSTEKEQSSPTKQQIESLPVVQDVEDDDDIEIEQPTEVSLRWNVYDSNMKTVLSNFLYEEQFVDVTLTCENESINCHKVILSASSPYFEKLFCQNPCRHPIVLMKDLYFWEVQALVEFIYKGEVKVPRYKLESLLDAAEALQIKGLAEPVDKMSTKNCQIRKRLFKKRSLNKNCNQGKKCLTVRNVRNFNKNSVEKSEIGTQTSSDSGNIVNNSNPVNSFPNSIQSQITDPNLNAYTVFTQTYPTFCQTASSQNLTSISNPTGTFPQLSHPSVPGSEASCVPVLMSQMAFPPVTLSDVPQASVLRNYQNHSSLNSFTVSCTSATQTSPQREEDVGDSPPDNNPPKKQRVSAKNKRINYDLMLGENDSLIMDNIYNKNKSNNKAITKCKRRSNRNDNSIDEKINSLMSRGDTNIIFTRKKTADMESIANRTRKKQSEVVRKRRLKIFD